MRRRLALLLLVAFLLGGCWDRTEIDDVAYVVSIGIDLDEQGYIWTFRIIEAERLPIGALTIVPPEPEQARAGIISVRAESLQQAVQVLQASLARVVSLEQMRSVLLGEAVAEKGIGFPVSQLLRHHQVRRGVALGVTTGPAQEIFRNNRPVADINLSKFLEGIMLVQKRVHLGPPARLQHAVGRLVAPGADPMLYLVAVNRASQDPPGTPIPPRTERSMTAGEFPRKGGNPVEFAGAAVFRGDRMAGRLTVDQLAAVLALRGEMGKVYDSVPDLREPEKLITLRFHQENKPEYQAFFRGGKPVVHVKLQFEGEILSAYGKADYSSPQDRKALEQHIARHLTRTQYEPVMRQVYREWGSDPIGIGNLYRRFFPTFTDWMAYKWSDHVKDLQATVEVKLYIRRFGMLLDNPNISGIR